MNEETEDGLLLKQLRNNNEKALDALFKKYYPGLLSFCKFQLPYPSDEAEDIVLEVFFKIWKNCNTLFIQNSLSSYLYISVKNRVYDFQRKNKLVVHEMTDHITDEAAPDYSSPDEQLIFKELNLQIDGLIGQLPTKTQLIFRMNRQEDLTYNDIALILNISVNSVKTHMYRALKFLKMAYNLNSINNNL